MDNNKIPDQNQEENWFDDLMHRPKLETEIGPDESAVAGLSDLSDLEFEKIMREALTEPVSTPEILAAEEAESVPLDELPDEYADEGAPAAAEEENEEEEA